MARVVAAGVEQDVQRVGHAAPLHDAAAQADTQLRPDRGTGLQGPLAVGGGGRPVQRLEVQALGPLPLLLALGDVRGEREPDDAAG